MVNAFSFCLYGPENPRYYPGMLENVYLARVYFPTWKVYVYYAPDVTAPMVAQLAACSNVVLRPTGILGEKNMIQRFFAIDEPGVDVMMVRDADSRIHWKDRWAIRDFVASPWIAHTIRDNPEHTACMMGGLWGLKKSAGLNVRKEYGEYIEDTERGFRNAHDQNFLADVIYPKVVSGLLVHYSMWLVFVGEKNHVRFPFEWTNDIYCGRIENDFIDTPEPTTGRFAGLPPALVNMRRVPGTPFVPQPPDVTTIEPARVSINPKLTALNFLHKK